MKLKILLAALLVNSSLQSQNTGWQQPVNADHFPARYDSISLQFINANAYIPPMRENVKTANALTNTFHLVKDINTITDANPGNFSFAAYYTQQYAVLNNTVYFSADDGIHGRELWKSDGTVAGTKMVKDIYAGETGAGISDIIVLNGKLYFFAESAEYGRELWTSDGTTAGTKLLKDMIPGTTAGYPMSICNVNGTLFFLNTFGIEEQLWKTNGTAAGTVMVSDLTTEKGISQILQMVAVNNILFFTAQSTNFDNRELWRSDGTAAGTFMVKDINPNPSGNGPTHLTAYNNKLYFCANDGANEYLWVSDGTPAGTTYAPGFNNVTINTVNSLYPLPFIVAGGIMYFPAYNFTYGSELFKYNANDGAGVVLVKDINAVGNSTYFTTDVMAATGNIVYFGFTDINGLSQLWKTNGSDAGTKKVADLPGATAYLGFFTGNGMLYFNASTATTGYEAWRSDGTAANTGMLKDIYSGMANGYPTYFTACNNKIFFTAQNKTNGYEVWQTDGTVVNTVLVKDINKTATSGSSPSNITAFNNAVIFNAYTPDKGNEAYISDSTAAGTKLIKDVLPGPKNGAPAYFSVKNNYAYFAAADANSDNNILNSIFRTDGTSAHTIELCNFSRFDYYFYGDYAVADNGLVFYILYNRNTSRQELWRTDGTGGGTYLLKSSFNYTSKTITAMGNYAYFSANDLSTSYGTEIWKSDGTITGTKLLKDIFSGSASSSPHDLFVYNDTLYFGAYGGTANELWKSNGTTSGTKKIRAVYPTSFRVSGNTIYFSGNTSTYGYELWKTNGTAATTKLVKDIATGTNGSFPSNLTDANGTLFFTANDGVNGVELWKTNGTAGNTKLVKDITTGTGSNFNGFAVAASRLFFVVYDASLGRYALWTSDGTRTGTYAVNDDGLNSITSISELEGNGNLLYLNGANYTYGGELYVGDASLISGLQKTDAVAKALPVNNFSAQLLANPFSDQLNLNISSAEKQKVKLVVSDASGNIYYNSVIDVPAGSINHKINTASWFSGIYVIHIANLKGKSNMVTLKAVK